MDELEQLRKKLEIAIATLKIYADESNWNCIDKYGPYGKYYDVEWTHDLSGYGEAVYALDLLQECNEF